MTDPQEPFNAKYYQHMLQSLTLNSRALIVELTAMAESFVDHAPEIVDLIEDRITKILPKYKLYSFYLLDSVIKNIGNPYNVLFARNLYRLFTESYLIVEDTATRQDLINLFQTWMNGQSSSGLDIFPRDVLVKIESFIIKATSLAGGSPQATPKVTVDAILREGNYLLQYIIAMDDELDTFSQQLACEDEKVRKWRLLRNDLVFEINAISENTMNTSKEAFDQNKKEYTELLQRIRKEMDDQAALQRELIKSSMKETTADTVDTGYPKLNNIYKRIDVVMMLDPNEKEFMAAVEKWGQPRVLLFPSTTTKPSEVSSNLETVDESKINDGLLPGKTDNMSLAQSLGLSFSDIEFAGFEMQKTQRGSFDECEDADDSDSLYSPDSGPEISDPEDDYVPKEPVKNFIIMKSSLKRPRSIEHRVVKRVRFET